MKVFITISFLLLFLQTNSQNLKIAEDYFEAIKTKSLSPISDYFLTTEQQIKALSWPNTPFVKNGIDSLTVIYHDSLLNCFRLIDAYLKKRGIPLLKCKLIKSNRTFGNLGNLELVFSYKKKSASIFIDVIDFAGKDYFLHSFPLENPPILRHTAFTTINNIDYPIWTLRNSELQKANSILKKNKRIEFEGKALINYSYLTLLHGIITPKKEYCAYIIATNQEDTTKVFILIDLEKEKIIKIEKEQPSKKHEEITYPFFSDEENIHLSLEEKYNKNLADNFLLVRNQRKKLDSFIDSLRTELVNQSGGYIEPENDRKIPKENKNIEIPYKILITERKGYELKQKIISLKIELLNLVGDLEKRESIEKELTLKINEKIPKENGKTWEEYTFSYMPLAAIFPMLRKFQNDASTSENIIINYLLNNE